VAELRGGVPNFTSMLRTTCLLHISGAAQPEPEELALLAASAA